MIKKRQFPTPTHGDIAMAIDAADDRRHFWEKFDAFVELSHAALWQGVRKMAGLGFDQELEDRYLRRFAQFKDGQQFARALALLTNALEEDRRDWLGEVFMATEISNRFAGQFFTPQPVAEAMALSIQKVLHERGFWPWHYWVEAIDIAPICARMAYIQMTLCGVPGRIHLGNTLSLEIQETWLTFAGASYPYSFAPPVECTVALPDVKIGEQMALELS